MPPISAPPYLSDLREIVQTNVDTSIRAKRVERLSVSDLFLVLDSCLLRSRSFDLIDPLIVQSIAILDLHLRSTHTTPSSDTCLSNTLSLSNFNTVFEKFKFEAANNKANLILLLADNDPFTNHSRCPGYRSSENSSDQLAMVVAVQAGNFRMGDTARTRSLHRQGMRCSDERELMQSIRFIKSYQKINHGKFIHRTNEALAASQELAMEATSQELAMEARHAQTTPFHVIAALISQVDVDVLIGPTAIGQTAIFIGTRMMNEVGEDEDGFSARVGVAQEADS
ncbi:hypothetical protein Tco_0439789 [Tanacetum coccineum]